MTIEVIWAALIAGLLALGGVWLGGRVQAGAAIRQAKVSVVQQHNDQAAAAIAQLLLTTDKLQPDSFIWEQEHGDSRQRILDLIEELRDQQVALTHSFSWAPNQGDTGRHDRSAQVVPQGAAGHL